MVSRATRSAQQAAIAAGDDAAPPPAAKRVRAPANKKKNQQNAQDGTAPVADLRPMPGDASPRSAAASHGAIGPENGDGWLPAPLRNHVTTSTPTFALDPQLSQETVPTSQRNDVTQSSSIDHVAENAALRAQVARLEAASRASDDARKAAEEKAEQLQRRAQEARLREFARRLAPIPRPSRPRGATWAWAPMEEILGLSPPSDRQDTSYVKKARVALYHWFLHTSRLVLDKAHRSLAVDVGDTWRETSGTIRKKMLDLFRAEIKRYAFLWPVFYHANIERKPGTQRFKNDWPLKELLKRTMKNERDGLRRPKKYAKEARKHLDAAKAAGETMSVLEYPVIRYDAHGAIIANVYDVSHQSDNGSDDEDDEEVASARRARRDASAGEELSEYRKAQLEKEAREKQLLEVEDADYYDVAEQADVLASLTSQVPTGDERELEASDTNGEGRVEMDVQ
ncbi:hypothetical protein QFC20_004814 [Naganishia adeliensis]|uniref:Uncharacterized protein n=1 Tax=Naganishia adeliensis TaxID=92952 RepID=A0ACC2VW42_9TREE|nr:hypothetical protein QFC20_004814 [Naganishia adeliensis]